MYSNSTNIYFDDNENKDKKEETSVKVQNKKFNRSKEEGSFYLQIYELSIILEYLNTFFFPFIRLYYHFLNIEEITENKKIEIIIAKPVEVPPLSQAVEQIINQYNIDDEFLANNSTKFRIVTNSSNQQFKTLKDINLSLNKEELIVDNKVKDKIKNSSKDDLYDLNNKEGNEEVKIIQDIINKKIDDVMMDVDKTIKIKQTYLDNIVDEANKIIKPQKK